MREPLLISVVIPAYNADRYLGAALDSVLAQSYRRLDIIVVDDGSTDRTAEVVRGFGSAVRYDYQPHGGISTAVNHGIELSRGECLAFLDADDLWTSEKLTLQMAVLEANPELEAVFGAVECFLSPELDAESRRKLVCPAGLLRVQMKPAMLIRRASFSRIGLFDPGLRIGEFIDWQARALDQGLRTATLPQLVLRRRIHGANTTLRESHSKTDYVRIARAALLRRRQQPTDAKAATTADVVSPPSLPRR